MLEVRDLRFAYPSGGFSLHVPELDLSPGESLGLGGPSGTGKTTVLKLLSGILPPASGSVQMQGKTPTRAARLQTMGLVFQDFALLEYLSAWDNILLPLRLAGLLTREHETRAVQLLETVDMAAHRHDLAGRLSQGEQQRVAVVRALVHQPKLVLADEPTSALDAARRRLVADLLQRHVREHGAMLIMVSHDHELYEEMSWKVNVEDWAA